MRIVLRLLGALPFVADDPLKNFRENLANSRFIANAQFPMQVGIRCSPRRRTRSYHLKDGTALAYRGQDEP